MEFQHLGQFYPKFQSQDQMHVNRSTSKLRNKPRKVIDEIKAEVSKILQQVQHSFKPANNCQSGQIYLTTVYMSYYFQHLVL